MDKERVIVVGAGPVGLVSALSLAQAGIPAVVLEAESDLTVDMRAGSFHPPTLEMMAPLGITERMLAFGLKVPKWQYRDRRNGVVAEFDLGLLADETPYPYRLHCEQHAMTPIVLGLLEAFAPEVEVRFSHRVTGVKQTGDFVTVEAATPDGIARVEGRWLIAADGGKSTVRGALGFDFEGFTWPELFVVVGHHYDLGQHGFTENAYVSDPDEWAAVFKMPHHGPPGLWRVAFPADPNQGDETVLSETNCQALLSRLVATRGAYDIVHRGVYRVHQRVATTFRKGRVLLAGDAAHVNNPLGALGLNGGIHDAVNLTEKLARVIRGEAGDDLLDRYDRQRRLINHAFVQAQSIRNKRLIEERDPEVRRKGLEEMRAIADDPARHKAFLLQSSMIDSVRRAAEIA